MKPHEIVRWAAILVAGGFGLVTLPGGLPPIYHAFKRGDWGWGLFSIWLMLVVTGIPLVISYLVFRRQYRPLVTVGATIAAISLWCLLTSLPRRLGLEDYLFRPAAHAGAPGLPSESGWHVALGLFAALLLLFGPIYAARWFYRLCLRLADRYLFHDAPPTPTDSPSPAIDRA